jgi:serine/threonine-protein kinase
MTPVPPSSPPGGSRPGSGGGVGHTSPTPTGFIGRYQILEKIGEGGMGSLYLARDPAIDRLVAIKVLRRGFDTEAVRERFAREARAAGRLRHPNIVTIFDVGEHDGDPFIAMEFLAGETLAELVRQGAGLTLSRRVKLLEELCDGLAYAHRAGLVHRDIKPANLMVDAEGVLKILDFGIVRVSDSGVTQAGVLVGTINYMSPEQVLGTGVDHRSDIFAVGLVAYELLTGRQAFPGTMKDGLLKRIPNAEIEPLSSALPGVDPEIAAIVEHALKKDPADRYPELARMRNDLAKVRLRIEAMEERAAASAIASSAETALISEEPTAAGVVLQPPRQSTPEFLVDAERALAEGNFRFALTIAGRAAAMNPADRYPSSIVARAEAGLLDRGRSYESSSMVQPRGASSTETARVAAQPVTPASTAGPSRTANFLAITVAMMALIVAAFAVFSQMGSRDRRTDGAFPAPPAQVPDRQADSRQATPPAEEKANPKSDPPSSSDPAPAVVPAPPAPAPAIEKDQRRSGRQGRETADRRDSARGQTPPPPRPSNPPPAPQPPAPAEPVRAGTVVPPPVVTRSVPAGYPPDARDSGAQGTVTVEVTIGTDGRVSDARVLRAVHPALDAAALSAARQWTFQPSTLDGRAVSVLHSLELSFSAPEPVRPPSSVPGTPRSLPTTPPPPVKTAEPPKEPAAPARDVRAEAVGEVRDLLKRYKAAREARSFEALRQVHRFSAAEASAWQRALRDTREVVLEMTVDDIQMGADRRQATAHCTYKLMSRPFVGDRNEQSGKAVFELEKLGDRWWVMSVRW